MFARLLLAVILIPLVELALLAQLSQRLGLATTILVVLVTGFCGVSVARRQGQQAWRQIHQLMAAGQSPSREILDGALILLAGIFLITPGLLTDTVGLCLLIPGLRRKFGQRLQEWFLSQTARRFQSSVWISEVSSSGVPDHASDESDGVQVRVIERTKVVRPL